MKTLWRVSLGAVVLSLILVSVVLADQSGVSGKLWDSGSPSQPWAHGAQVAARKCESDGDPAFPEVWYACDNANTTGDIGRFDFAWSTDNCANITAGATPSPGDHVCLYIIWADGGSGQPATTTATTPQQVSSNVTGRMTFGNIVSGTGPNAITLTNVTARSANLWLPVGLAALSVLAVGALIITRRRRS